MTELNYIYIWSYIYNVKQLNIQMLSDMFLPHDAGQGAWNDVEDSSP